MTDGTADRTRVLWLIKGLGPGGAEQLLASSAGEVDRSRFRYLTAYVRRDKGHLVQRLESEQVSTRLLTDGRLGGALWPLRLRTLMAHSDIVHAHSPLLAGVARLLVHTIRPAARPAMVSTEHNEWSSFSAPTRHLNALTSGLDDHRFAVSERVRDSMSRAARAGTEVLIHGVVHRPSGERDASAAASTRTSLGLRREDIVAITVANYRKEKDYPNLLRAAQLALRQDEHLHLLVVGQGPLEPEVQRLHKMLGLGERVRLLGYRDDVPDLLAASDVFVLGSAHEGLPVALMEAMAAGLPIVATDVGGIADAVRPGTCGVVVKPRDPAALADALVTMASDPSARCRMGDASLNRSTMFDLAMAVRRQEAVYGKLAPMRRGHRRPPLP